VLNEIKISENDFYFIENFIDAENILFTILDLLILIHILKNERMFLPDHFNANTLYFPEISINLFFNTDYQSFLIQNFLDFNVI
jgi:hypothetical protein